MGGSLYRRLQKQLNRQAVGFPATITGADIRLLKSLFTEKEAAVACHLDCRYADGEDIFHRAAAAEDLSIEEARSLLDEMMQKGLVAVRKREGRRQYRLMPLVVGIYEGQVNRLTPEFRKAFSAYTGSLSYGISWITPAAPQMRTIPIKESISPETELHPANDVTALLDASPGPFAVLECICRKKKALEGEPCSVTERKETCLALGDLAAQTIEMKAGREITRSEAEALLDESKREGLVLQPSNSAEPEFICSCCGCCCGMLGVQKMLPRPLDFWTAPFAAALDADACTGCGRCAAICQVDAITFHQKKKRVTLDLNRCIGCGNCVAACPSGALSLVEREQKKEIPPTMDDLYETIMRRKKSFGETLMVIVKFLLRIRQ